jgi:rRNA maturation RNase YbeY
VKKKVFLNDIPNLNLKRADLLDWIHGRVSEKGVKIKRLDINFISEDRMLNLNREHLKHDNHTDILTFCYNDHLDIESEIFICFERARENAKKYSKSIDNEILRLISHGLLHVFGMKDDTKQEKEAMGKEEERFIRKFHVKHARSEKTL